MKVYIAGPMTGLPQFNIPAFDLMAGTLRSEDFEVVSPVELDGEAYRQWAIQSPDGASMDGNPNGWTWGHVLARDVELIADDGIEGIVALPGWERSRGARLETFVADAMCNIPVYTWKYDRLHEVSRLTLFKAWTAEPLLSIGHRFLHEVSA